MSHKVDIIELGRFNPETQSRYYEALISKDDESVIVVSGYIGWLNRPNRSPIGHIYAQTDNNVVRFGGQMALINVMQDDLAADTLIRTLGQTRTFTFED